jgi:hypothetical protein
MNVLTIPSRFNGPAGVGNGGYVCGRIAAYVDGPAAVTLRRPPPLDTPMKVERDDDGSVRVRHGRTLIGEAAPSPVGPPEIAVTVSPAEADTAAGNARYFRDPVFPDCFVCGMNRQPGDGLRIFPGPVTGRGLWAAPWKPDPSVAGPDGRVRPEVVWAALDCPSGIAAAEAAGLSGEPGWDTAILLGRMTATTLAARPRVGDRCRVIAWPERRDGRKLTAGSALIGPDGEVLAVAGAVWLTVPRPERARAAKSAPAAKAAKSALAAGGAR